MGFACFGKRFFSGENTLEISEINIFFSEIKKKFSEINFFICQFFGKIGMYARQAIDKSKTKSCAMTCKKVFTSGKRQSLLNFFACFGNILDFTTEDTETYGIIRVYLEKMEN